MPSTEDPTGSDWSNSEIDLIVADYFEMLKLERAGAGYVKAERNRALQELTRRSRGSIEFKHQNISAVLHRLGMDWITGYKPMANYQKALLDGIERYLDSQDATITLPTTEMISSASEDAVIYLEEPPQISFFSSESEPLTRLVRKFDAAERDARNRTLGKLGEERVFFSEKKRLKAEGRADLAQKVRWISEEDGDGAGYDIRSYTASGAEQFLEVKTTVGSQTTPFYLTENERLLSSERPKEFRLYRLYEFNREPKAFQLIPPLESAVILQPSTYKASFRN